MTIEKKIEQSPGPSPAERGAPRVFRDLEPFFARKHLTYVDAGAHRGDMFRGLLQSGLKVREAHLIEPNPRSFRMLAESVALPGGIPPVCHHLALAAAPGRLRLRDADTMTRVIGPADADADAAPEAVNADGTFEVPATTLDELARGFGRPRISILKIDVEGYELEVLAGARRLLADQAIDVIYLEAGMNPEGGQQTYYRAIEDRLRTQGYRLFRIYEQKHEWLDDSPLLRRVNLAFMSEGFASRHPYQLSRDLMQASREVERLGAALSADRDELGRSRERIARLEAQLGEQTAAVAALRAELEAARAEVESRRGEEERQRRETAALEQQLSRLRGYGRDLERRHRQLLASHSWRAMEPVRWVSRTLRRRGPPAPFVPRLTTGLDAGPLPGPAAAARPRSEAERLDDKLWGGFSRQALVDLEALATAPKARKGVRSEAAWMLARWHAANGAFDPAYESLLRMHAADPGSAMSMRSTLLEATCLIRRGAPAEAQALVGRALRTRPGNPHLCLAMSNALAADPPGDARDAKRLDWINRIYRQAGLAPLTLRDPGRPLAIDNLAAEAPAAAGTTPAISVIVPAFRAGATLPFALRGLLAQTWRNLEILVVDDCSPDDTVAVAEAVAATDPRVRVLRQPENRGSYAARNAGLRAATGDFVTTHDADDWSHPQKLESQVRHALAHPEAAATFSPWVRCTADLQAGWLYRPWGGYIAKNMSSIMLRREAFEELGGWDEVQVSGDTDLLRRVEQLWGTAAVVTVREGAPLAFSLHEERSMTRQGGTHVRTMLHGPRHEYGEAGAFWREQAGGRADLRLPREGGAPRPFPAPLSILPGQAGGHAFDLLFVTDFCFRGGAFVSTLNYIRAARAAGLSVGVFHWRRYDLDVTQALNPKIRSLAQDGEIRVVAPGERVRATTVVIGYPVILVQPIDLFPEVAFENLVVVVNQMAARLHSGDDAQYDPRAIRATLREILGREGTWVPISGLVQRLMRDDPRYPAPSDTVWVPLIDTASWCADPLRWRGGDGARPVVGRHARDQYTKWPSDAAALRGAYCADRPCAVELMGGARSALAVIGGAPANWTVHAFDAMESIEFLRRLDFFVHYPHEDYIEEFGRAVLEALALGLPAILPPVFRETFGDAAVYAEPAGAWERIDALWRDEAGYLAQARRGRDFVRARSDWAEFPERLARTLAADPAAPRPVAATAAP